MNMRNTVNEAAALVAACRQRLEEALGGTVKTERAAEAGRGYDFDAEIGAHPVVHLAVEVKRQVATRNQALHVIFQLQHGAKRGAIPAVFAEWIAEPAAEELRRAGVFFVDVQGNAFLRKPPQFVLDIRGRKLPHPIKADPGRLIEPGGLKVIHYLLTHPAAAGAPLRAIGQHAGVALGTAHTVKAELLRAQWLLPAGDKGARFGDIKGLIELFVRGYALKLRPACVIGRYRHQKKQPLAILDGFAERLADLKGHWAVTGGMAALELMHYLEPDTATLFVDDQAQAKLEGEPMLRDDAAGNVTLLRLPQAQFIATEPRGAWPIVTPLMVYAELLQDAGQREIEAAQMIYERFIAPMGTHGR